ncbi:conserved unknown protein [Ectocarpus siliculosus]|uniref:CRAL-TRIO domain-containing protein n=1 Tax=Ectocarpus siliculosus TaxID=2880 RepID=D8LI57_ECTSI|nr:conserved unknown protein [Ectocarpus siliculosus]|eukprot:CBN79393.1 conserved unknown protein [Ectocarpus siliculosus]
MPATPLFHPKNESSKGTGRLGRLTKREAASLASLKQLARKQGLSLGLVRGPGEQNDVCLLRFLRAQRFEEKRALASLVSCVEWGASVGLSGLRGHPGGGAAEGQEGSAPSPLPAAEGLVCLGSGFDRLGRPLVVVRLGGLTHSLVEACGKKALLRYFIWSVERVLERVASSMLSTQFIIEGSTVVCDARGWDQDNASDSVLSLLQDAAAIGLSRYPERLGQLFVVNVPAADRASGGSTGGGGGGLMLAARALGLGAALEAGKLRVLPGELPKWAPELLKAIPPEHLPVEYGGTAPALPRWPVLPQPSTADAAPVGRPAGATSPLAGIRAVPGAPDPCSAGTGAKRGSGSPDRGNGNRATAGSGVLQPLLSLANGGARPGRTSYTIGGVDAIALLLILWALHRESPRLGETAMLGLAVALLARECVGGAATLPSANRRVPLLHDPRALVAAAAAAVGAAASRSSNVAGTGVVAEGEGFQGGGVSGPRDGDGGWEGVSLLGGEVEVVRVVGRGKSGFDRFCVRVVEVASQSQRQAGVVGATAPTSRREWVAWRRLTEFVALRVSLMEAGCPAAEGGDRDTRMWQLPPAVPFGLLMQRLEAWLRRLLRDPEAVKREELRRFLLDAPRTTTAENVAAAATTTTTTAAASSSLPACQDPAIATNAAGTAAAAGAAASGAANSNATSRRRTAPTVLSTVHEPLSPISAAAAAAPAGSGGLLCPEAGGGPAEEEVGGGDDSAEARVIPSLRPELKTMFRDPGECHALRVPKHEHNQWLRRANRASATTSSSSSSSSSAQFVSPASTTTSPTLSRPPSNEGMGGAAAGGGGGRGARPPPWAAAGSDGGGADVSGNGAGTSPTFPVTPPGTVTGARVVSPRGDYSANGKHAGTPSSSSSSARRKDGASSPRRREALKRFVSLVKRKGGSKRGHRPYASGFKLLHVDVFQVPPGNHLHRVDHIVGRAGGRAQARVKDLTSQPGGFKFLFVVNLQLPRSFTKNTSAASVVLYWGVPAECLGGAGASPLDFSRCTPPPQPPRSPRRSASLASQGAATPISPSPPSSPPLPPAAFERDLLMRYIDLPFHRMGSNGSGFVSHEQAAVAGGERARGVPGFSADDEDESESGVFPDKDFRNMSLKVVTSVVEGRWTVRKAVDDGNAQVLSRKLNQRYFRGSLYMETDVEVGSSVAAESVVGVCLTEPCVLDVGFFLEGGHRVLGCVRVSDLRLKVAEPLLAPDSVATPPPPPVREFQDTWEDNGESHGFRVRGPGYLSGGGKVAAGTPFGKLVRADLYKMEAGIDRMDNIGSVGRSAKVVRRLAKKGQFLVIVNLQVPGNPPLSMVLYYAVPVPPGGVPEEGAGGKTTAFLDLFRRFVDLGPKHNSDEGDGSVSEYDEEGEGIGDAGGGGRLPGDDLRNMRFKLFPAILEGPWIVRKAVGSKPTLIAQKLTCRYFRTRSYFEVDIDIGSSVVAYNTVSLAIGYAKSLCVDMGFCIQGETDDEFPEVLLGVVRLKKMDVLLADNLGANEDPEDDDSSEDEEEDEEDEFDQQLNPLGGTGEGEDDQQGGQKEAIPVEGSAVAEQQHQAGATEAPPPARRRSSGTAMDAAVFVVPPGGGAQGGDPITSPGLEGVFIDSGHMHGLRVRGSSYLRDRRKISAGPSFGTLVRADLFRVDGAKHHLFRVDHICAHGRMKDRVAFFQSGPNPPFLFIVNIQMPGDRAHSVVLCWGMRLKEAMEADKAGRLSPEDSNFLRLFTRYISLDLEGGLPLNDIRNRRLKLFPKVLEGPWVVRKAVGKPCVIGKKLTARYFRRPGYFEVDIDVGSSTLASNATHLAGGYAKNLVLDLAFALQGESEDELPERLIGSARIVRPDLGRAEPLDW